LFWIYGLIVEILGELWVFMSACYAKNMALTSKCYNAEKQETVKITKIEIM